MSLAEIMQLLYQGSVAALAVFMYFVWRKLCDLEANQRVLMLYCPMIKWTKPCPIPAKKEFP